MNFLAHAYLSFGFKPLIIGNLISDFVKGKKQFEYPTGIQAGISLHRKIDIFTDHHIATVKAVKLLKPSAGRYAPVFMDVIYDHFLARDRFEFPGSSLSQFASVTYSVISEGHQLLPLKFRNMVPYMIAENWLENYGFTSNIQRSFNAIFRRAKYIDADESVFNTFLDKYEDFEGYYNWFFPDVKQYALSLLNETDKNMLSDFTF